MIPTHGKDLARIWRPEHKRNTLCPRCGGPVAHAGLTELAYTFEPCACPEVTYTHLVETVWHRNCLVAASGDSGGDQ